jgi:glutamyl-Q tRNA(Asp) synthetase
LGSLISALASYLDARHRDGRWLMRVEDIDPPREQPGASHSILNSLREHGLVWDGDVLWQSERLELYRATTEHLLTENLAFRCNCSRQMLVASDGVYNGHCRNRNLDAAQEHAVRIKVPNACHITVDDRIQQPLTLQLDRDVGDFVIWRRDNLVAYQLAVTLDDAEQGITDIVRGSDLFESTARQICLQRLLGLPTPQYAHIPVLTNTGGQKLSKQTHAPALDNSRALDNLRLALKFLKQAKTQAGNPQQLLQQAAAQWQPERIASTMDIPESALA